MVNNICANLLSLSVGIIGGADGPTTIVVYDRSLFEIISVVLICTAAAIILQIIFHEGGHLIFGLLSGYTFLSFRVFNLMIAKTKEGIGLKKFSLAGTGGQCIMRPPELKEDGRMPYLMYNLGGVLMNLITAAICLAIFLSWGGSLWVETLLLELVWIGIVFGLLNGIPFSTKVMVNDGRNILSMMKNKEAVRAFWLGMESVARVSDGVRIRDMPEEWFRLPSDEDMKDHLAATIAVLACNRALDRMDFEETKRLGSKIISDSSGALGLYKAFISMDLMYCELMGENRKEVLGKYQTKDIEKIKKAMAKHMPVLRTQYVYELLNNRDEKAAELALEKFEKAAKNYPYSTDAESERELIEYARQRYEHTVQGDT